MQGDGAPLAWRSCRVAGGRKLLPDLRRHLCCFIALIISTAALSAVNNIHSAAVRQAFAAPTSRGRGGEKNENTKPFHSPNSLQQKQPNTFTAGSGSTQSDSGVILPGKMGTLLECNALLGGRNCYWYQQYKKEAH